MDKSLFKFEYFFYHGISIEYFLDKSILNLDRHLAESAVRNIDILFGNVSIGSFPQTYANGYISGKVKGYQLQPAFQRPIVSLEKTFQ